ncbi:hypothetical protein [Priestia megaterium]|uniref:hypothetical protein n=1 Tax=Priestia megaterium TaxID=1404 RepID=UPI002E21A8FE|nr:hypothetical protein [Priestia megaterium]
MTNFVLKPLTQLELREIFDDTAVETIEFYLKRSFFAQPELVPGQNPLPIHVPKEHIEQWVVQAIGASPVGAGSYPVDVIKPGDFGADVKMLSCKVSPLGQLTNGDSGETSLAQKFQEAGNELDQLFASQDYETIVHGWTSILKSKLERVLENDSVSNIYYLFILRAHTKFYLCGLKVDVANLDNICVLRGTNSSVFIDRFIDSRYGNTKIYKAKKRLELRLKPKYWVENNLVIPFEFDRPTTPVSIRQLISEGRLEEYQDQIIREIF